VGPTGPTGPTGANGVSFAQSASCASAQVSNQVVDVCGPLVLGTGGYVVVGKLSLAANTDVPLEVRCELRQSGARLDATSVVLSGDAELPLTLVGATVVMDQSDDLTIACSKGSADAVSAIDVQMVAIAVDQVVGP
jgi:hypothetical protein